MIDFAACLVKCTWNYPLQSNLCSLSALGPREALHQNVALRGYWDSQDTCGVLSGEGGLKQENLGLWSFKGTKQSPEERGGAQSLCLRLLADLVLHWVIMSTFENLFSLEEASRQTQAQRRHCGCIQRWGCADAWNPGISGNGGEGPSREGLKVTAAAA